MARFGCKVLLRNICFTKELPILLVNQQLYYHPFIMIYDASIQNIIKIGDYEISTSVDDHYYSVSITGNSHYMILTVDKFLRPVCFLNYSYNEIRIYKSCIYTDHTCNTLKEMLSTDIFSICMPMFEFFKANSNLISS
jgi:hypothetical protein